MSLPRVRIAGIGLWFDGLPGWDAACAYARHGSLAEGAPRRPAPQLLAANERRRAPETVAVALEVALAACQSAAAEPSQVASVFASANGEMSITDYMCQTLATEPASLSPTRFHNSVHNAAAGYWTIGAGTHAPATAISAGPYSFAQGLVEALAQLADDQQQVLLVGYDGNASGPLGQLVPSHGLLGAALLLRRDGPGIGLQAGWQPRAASITPGPLQQRAAGNAGAAMLPLFDALALGHAHTCLAAGPAQHLELWLQHD